MIEVHELTRLYMPTERPRFLGLFLLTGECELSHLSIRRFPWPQGDVVLTHAAIGSATRSPSVWALRTEAP